FGRLFKSLPYFFRSAFCDLPRLQHSSQFRSNEAGGIHNRDLAVHLKISEIENARTDHDTERDDCRHDKQADDEAATGHGSNEVTHGNIDDSSHAPDPFAP